MYRHLAMLELQRYAASVHFMTHLQLHTRQTEASARAWIDTFFFRAMAMVPPTQRMVLNMEYTIPSTKIRNIRKSGKLRFGNIL